jgi:CheY-like chemotaxis protein/anti-sigma regulatory factor (Ser/Thr protein kinase)
VQQVLELTRARWSDMPLQRGTVIRLHTELAPDTPPLLGVDSEVREALINLLFNAVDAMPDGGVLTLRTRGVDGHGGAAGAPGRCAVIEVADSGVGMDESTRRRCLEPFFTTKGERGTGLGLAMVYGVAQRHGAEIEIDSEVGQGTTVRLIFPIAAAACTDAGPSANAHGPTARLRILIVDDDPLLLRSLRDTLELDGHAVTAANGGQAGIEAYEAAATQRDDTFDVVFTDLGMPQVDGRRVAAAVKAVADPPPVILLTGWGRRLVADGEMPAHVDQVLSKPPRLIELRAALAGIRPRRTHPAPLDAKKEAP